MWKKCGAIYTTQTQKNQGCSNCFYCRKKNIYNSAKSGKKERRTALHSAVRPE